MKQHNAARGYINTVFAFWPTSCRFPASVARDFVCSSRNADADAEVEDVQCCFGPPSPQTVSSDAKRTQIGQRSAHDRGLELLGRQVPPAECVRRERRSVRQGAPRCAEMPVGEDQKKAPVLVNFGHTESGQTVS